MTKLVRKADQNVRHMRHISYAFSPASFFNQKVWVSDCKSGKNLGKLRDWRAGGESRYYFKDGANNASGVLMCVFFKKRYAMDAMMNGYRFLYNWIIFDKKAEWFAWELFQNYNQRCNLVTCHDRSFAIHWFLRPERNLPITPTLATVLRQGTRDIDTAQLDCWFLVILFSYYYKIILLLLNYYYFSYY